jgi:hypothetical protein
MGTTGFTVHGDFADSATVIVDVDTTTQVAHYERRILRGCPTAPGSTTTI